MIMISLWLIFSLLSAKQLKNDVQSALLKQPRVCEIIFAFAEIVEMACKYQS